MSDKNKWRFTAAAFQRNYQDMRLKSLSLVTKKANAPQYR